MRIVYIGNFHKLWDEEYIAKSLEELGHNVYRIRESQIPKYIVQDILEIQPDFILTAKFRVAQPEWIMKEIKGIPIVSWIFDLYWGYTREHQIRTAPMFKADLVITTDGGHDQKWKDAGIKHATVRQGIYKPECYMYPPDRTLPLLFVGSENPSNKDRTEMIQRLDKDFLLHWVGRSNTNECRSEELNELYSRAKVVVGDSVFSPYYWSNRVVETLGRGGFLIHVDVPGLKEEYPDIVTYKRGDYADLKSKIEYYIENDKEREEIVMKNFHRVRNNYTCTHQCQKLIDIVCKELNLTK